MSEKTKGNDDASDKNRGSVELPEPIGKKIATVSSCTPSSSYSIEVCQGPDCTGLGGGVAILEIEELIREHHHQNKNRNGRICVVAGGCRDFCSVGPNAHIHVRRQAQEKRGKTKPKPKTILLESFQNVREATSCDRVVSAAIALSSPSESPCDGGNSNENGSPVSALSSMDRHRSMMARRTERKRWEALKEVSRTIAKCNKVVAATASATTSNSTDRSAIERKLRIWNETCKDRIEGGGRSIGQSQREQRRTKHLVEIASEKLNRICLHSESDSSSSYSSSDEESDTSDE